MDYDDYQFFDEPMVQPRTSRPPVNSEESQKTQGFVSTAFKCQSYEATTLCIYNAGSKLTKGGQYDIGGTYCELEPEFWFFFTSTTCPGNNYLLNLFVCHRKTGNFAIDISDSNNVTSKINEDSQLLFLPQTLTTLTFKSPAKDQVQFLKTFCLHNVSEYNEGSTLYIPIKLKFNPKIGIDRNILRSIKLQHDLSQLLTKKETTDLVLVSASKKQFPAHKILLAAHSPVMRNMLRNNPETLFFDIGDEEMELVLEFIYTGTIKDIVKKDCLKILELAAKFQLDPLYLLSQHVIIDHIDVDNAVNMAVIAKKYKLKELQDKVFAYILKNPKVMSTEAWRNLDDVELTKHMLQYTYGTRIPA